ncbi:hypothetical protein EJ08DRAFT_313937 [Tothia fuscella]|uniref:Uncharacterized protein n=1 Tax=Tothia fuscella TaxID=1048955 RepID=A0A9P4TX54_9PEZI|nr:hypothetical protein EJ08DRAFT_313937 [Tothia fuscella]
MPQKAIVVKIGIASPAHQSFSPCQENKFLNELPGTRLLHSNLFHTFSSPLTIYSVGTLQKPQESVNKKYRHATRRPASQPQSTFPAPKSNHSPGPRPQQKTTSRYQTPFFFKNAYHFNPLAFLLTRHGTSSPDNLTGNAICSPLLLLHQSLLINFFSPFLQIVVD